MRFRRSRDQAPTAAPAPEDGAQSWIAPPPRAALVTAATKIALWGLVGCGPAALLLAAANPASPESRPTVAAAGRSPAGPSGFAELYVAAYLRAANGDTSLKGFYPEAPDISNPPGQRAVSRTVTTDAREAAPGYWSVTVAADVAAKDKNGAFVAAGVHYFKVAVVALGDAAGGGAKRAGTGPGYVAIALPAEVSATPPGSLPDLAYDAQRQISTGPLADTVRQALAAYLSGAGDLSRYLSPGTALRPVVPAPYRQVELSGILLSRTLPDADTTVPGDGTRARILAKVDVTDGAGQRWPLTYALTMTARAGRWELTALDDAPLLTSSRPGAASPPASPGTRAPAVPGPSPSGSAPSGPTPTQPPEQAPTGGTAPSRAAPSSAPSN